MDIRSGLVEVSKTSKLPSNNIVNVFMGIETVNGAYTGSNSVSRIKIISGSSIERNMCRSKCSLVSQLYIEYVIDGSFETTRGLFRVKSPVLPTFVNGWRRRS